MSTPETPLLKVVRGNPDDAELAALTAVVAAAAGARAPEPAPKRDSWWADKASLVRAPLAPGEGAWRASALPR
ncbi:acetyl-CoA carboxylase biotin carboxyl carrier protein subunit [Amycolatopsis sp. WAC 01375]|uniref:acyl-CoA carboxylase subunit epsilon n=1 Tax=unclassified Amycolatopsis TaxID=2618356 RepID=UPI000F7BA54C|nr:MULTISPECIES: acyl-CoA carboxylase subunit epsilon [unclassified Amycolatopsis]RSM54254.1 acetyl-CoA carboxylase biotin carboxyl carrier protein subunit [Amycolatopsis sp. WAC 01376]RSM71359.1 acetyl-CoA carboxylase biotin carboxyl carrier protein subunit [Amycolatopsis sp. WAC 01375]RSN36140.1 acetyl-CoA carboxylase biotin carboxyl carrier protein subunit [Amycolatopsis sp. WAC 01416]